MTYPEAFQHRIFALAKTLVSEGIAWDPEQAGRTQVRHDARPSFAVEDSARSLLEDLRRWYEDVSRPLTGAFVAETRSMAQLWEQDCPIRAALMALAARCAAQNCRLVEERALIAGLFLIENERGIDLVDRLRLIVLIEKTEAPLAVPPAREPTLAEWRQGERDLVALIRLQLLYDIGMLYPAASANLEIRVAERTRHPPTSIEELRRRQRGKPLEPVGWRESIAHVSEQLAGVGILWHPRQKTILHHPGARVPESLVQDVTALLVRLRSWWFLATPPKEVGSFAARARRQARTWRNHGEIAWRGGADECERLALRAERLKSNLPEAREWVQARVTGRWPIVQPSNELPETSTKAEEGNLSLEDAHVGLWRLATAMHRRDLRTTGRAAVGAS